MAYSIQIDVDDTVKVLKYISKSLDVEKDNARRFKLYLNSKNEGKMIPYCGDFTVTHEGETFQVSYHEEGPPLAISHIPNYYKRLLIKHDNYDTLKAFVTKVLTYRKLDDKQKICVYHGKSRGFWDLYNSIYAQPMDMIYISPAIKDSIIHQIDTFLNMKDKYIKYGRPYKLNFLFTGVPGSGKSSLVKSLAQKYNRKLYITGFSKSLTDENLLDLMQDVKDDSIILFEDIDAFFVDRKAIDINLSFSCLINIMDGVLNRGNGNIIILTANNPERLDPAIIRPGRIDRIIKFDYPKKPEIEAAFRSLIDHENADFDGFWEKIKKNTKLSMSSIIDHLFRHPTDYIEKVDELHESNRLIQELMNDKSEKIYT